MQSLPRHLFTGRRLTDADNRGFGHGGGRSGERRPLHHGGEGGGGGGGRGAGQRQQALLDEGLWVRGHLTQCGETPLQAHTGSE